MITKVSPQKAVEYFENKLEFTLGPAELKHKIEENSEEITVIDVRRPEDFEKGHVPGAVNLPKEKWSTFEGLDKSKVNICYCYSQQCHLAANACKLFAENGYSVMELEGGIQAWRQYGYDMKK